MIRAPANAAWFASALPEALAFRRACGRVAATQESVLFGILRKNGQTEFGRRMRFGEIGSAEEYRDRIAPSNYEDYASVIERIASGEANVLTADPVTHFVPTSGTSSGSKLIPYTPSLLRDFQRAIAPWIVDLFSTTPSLLDGTAFWSVSPVLQRAERTAGGIPIGFDSDDAYLGGWTRSLVRAIQAVPPDVARIRDVDGFRYATLFFLAARRDLRLVSVWNPTFFSLLVSPLVEWFDDLVRDVRDGTISRLTKASTDPATFHRLEEMAASRRDARRSREIERALSLSTPAERHSSLWPKLRVVSCWADAAAERDAANVGRLFPQAVVQPKGLISTEGFVSIPLSGCNGAALAIRSHFFEFRESGSGTVRLAGELEEKTAYEVLLTTSGGLYRYASGDTIEVTGYRGECPLLRFTGRIGAVSDFFGEKLSEEFVRRSLERVTGLLQANVRFAMVARDEPEGFAAGYALFIEADAADAEIGEIAAAIDVALRDNVHYAYCRDLGQLARLRPFRVERNGAAAYLAGCTALGQRLGEIKPVALHRANGWSARFEGRWIA